MGENDSLLGWERFVVDFRNDLQREIQSKFRYVRQKMRGSFVARALPDTQEVDIAVESYKVSPDRAHRRPARALFASVRSTLLRSAAFCRFGPDTRHNPGAPAPGVREADHDWLLLGAEYSQLPLPWNGELGPHSGVRRPPAT